jgi:DNA-binding transcriptional ArsR family regulator
MMRYSLLSMENLMEGIQVISRAAAILRAVGAQPDGLSLGKLANATGLARSTVQRIVDALEMEHLVQAGAGGVRPGWGLRRLGELPGSGIDPERGRGAVHGPFPVRPAGARAAGGGGGVSGLYHVERQSLAVGLVR